MTDTPTFRARYGKGDTQIVVTVDEDDARAAYNEHADDMGWGPFEDHRLEAAEHAATLQITREVIDSLPDNVELQTGACAGVWEVEE